MSSKHIRYDDILLKPSALNLIIVEILKRYRYLSWEKGSAPLFPSPFSHLSKSNKRRYKEISALCSSTCPR